MTTWIEGSEVARGATAVVTRGRPGTVVKTLEPTVPPASERAVLLARVEATR